jgi:hypothetical protein
MDPIILSLHMMINAFYEIPLATLRSCNGGGM